MKTAHGRNSPYLIIYITSTVFPIKSKQPLSATLATAAMPEAAAAAPRAAAAGVTTVKEQTFTIFAKEFGLDAKVLALLLKSSMENLEDLRFWFNAESDVDSFITEDDTIKDQDMKLQVSRLRRDGQHSGSQDS